MPGEVGCIGELFENELSSLFIVLKIRKRFPVEHRQIHGKFVGRKEAHMSRFVRRGNDGPLPAIDPKSQGEHLDLIARGGGKGKARLSVQGNGGCFQGFEPSVAPQDPHAPSPIARPCPWCCCRYDHKQTEAMLQYL